MKLKWKVDPDGYVTVTFSWNESELYRLGRIMGKNEAADLFSKLNRRCQHERISMRLRALADLARVLEDNEDDDP